MDLNKIPKSFRKAYKHIAPKEERYIFIVKNYIEYLIQEKKITIEDVYAIDSSFFEDISFEKAKKIYDELLPIYSCKKKTRKKEMDNIIAILYEIGLDIQDIIKKTGLTKQTIYNILSGKYIPHPSTLQKFKKLIT